jgi:hypothetical protein
VAQGKTSQFGDIMRPSKTRTRAAAENTGLFQAIKYSCPHRVGLSSLLTGVLLLLRLSGAVAQISIGEQRLSQEVNGGTVGSGSESNSLPSAGQAMLPPRHRDPGGRTCLEVIPMARKQAINPSIYDQILILDNRCSTDIRLRACYFGTNSCKVMSVGAYKRVEQLLGVFPSQVFRFSFREFVK